MTHPLAEGERCVLPCGCILGCKGEGADAKMYVAAGGFDDPGNSHRDDWHAAILKGFAHAYSATRLK